MAKIFISMDTDINLIAEGSQKKKDFGHRSFGNKTRLASRSRKINSDTTACKTHLCQRATTGYLPGKMYYEAHRPH